MAIQMRIWSVTGDGCLAGVVPHVGGEKTIKTSRIIDSHINVEGKTVVRTEGGSIYVLTGPSRAILVAEANASVSQNALDALDLQRTAALRRRK